jgi:hypothetical protein
VSRNAARVYLQSTFYMPIVLSVLAMATLLVCGALFNEDDPHGLLFVTGIILCGFGFLVHRASLSSLEFSADGATISSNPSLMDRKFWGQRQISARLSPGSELLFCRRSAYGSPAGFQIVLRDGSGKDNVLLDDSEQDAPSARHWARIAKDVEERNHIRSRLIRQSVTSSGTIEEEWSPALDRKRWSRAAPMMITGMFPYLGAAVRLLTPSPLLIVITGLLLWLLAGAINIAIFHRNKNAWAEDGVAASLLGWFLSFAGFYAAAAVLTNLALARYWPGH